MLHLAVVILAVHVVDFMDGGAPHVCGALDIPAGRNRVLSGRQTPKLDKWPHCPVTTNQELT